MSLDAEQAQPSSGEGRTGRALALTALIPSAVIALDPVQLQPLPSQVASIARALAAKISS